MPRHGDAYGTGTNYRRASTQRAGLNWREKCKRGQARLAIEDSLDEGLPRAYTPDVYEQKCGVLFEHVFESYGDAAV